MATASNITMDSLVELFNTLPISEACRLELLECLRVISLTDRDLYVNIIDAVQTARKIKNGSNFRDIILISMQFESTIKNVLQMVLPAKFGNALNVVMLIFRSLFRTTGIDRNLVAKVVDGVQQILDDDAKHECEGIKSEIWDSVAYLTGVPATNELSQEERIHVLCGLGSNLTVKGSKQLGIIRSKIKDMVKKRDMGKFDVFMKYVELYCSLTILRELALLYHFAVLSAYGAPNANCVKNVLDQHRANDESLFNVIRFLHKPGKDTLRLHLKYNAQIWEIIQNFLNKHELLEDPSRFYDKALQIFSEKDKNATLSSQRILSGSNRIRCYKNTNMENTVFQFCKPSKETGNTFSIHPLRWSDQHVTSRWSCLTCRKGEPSDKGKWRLVEMEPDAPDQPSVFVIVLDSSEDQCIYTDNYGYVYVKRFNDSDSGYFWTLNVL